MCHLILLLPVFALPIFWLMPLSLALPLYLAIAAVSGWFYWVIVRAMTGKVDVGIEGFIGAEAEVVASSGSTSRAKYLVRSRGELWTARCQETLDIGEKVHIAALNGVGVMVKRKRSTITRVHQNERHCH